jgi:UDP-N-acetyl-D-mannosaminuronic acid transferase (WecB/TagA/CpsF family)
MHGATFDFIAARAARYPVIMRRSQLHKAIRKALHPGKQKIQAVGGYS